MMPLLERHDDLALVGRMLVLTPVRNVLRFICIDRESDVYAFDVRTCMNLTFFDIGHWPLSGGWRLAADRGSWDIRYPTSLEVLRQMIEEALPEMRRVNTIDEFVTYQNNSMKSLYRSSLRPNGLALIAIANGDLEKALSIVEPAIASREMDWTRKYYNALKQRDCTAFLYLLREQQARTIGALKLAKHFEPEPFGVEKG
ncbi:hypothetical protein [Phyllobacterium zundukense]|uniref:Uncharacterized protein n=1 Tax=Phyllobacterium zundukense TaxID=1867719 RepID=A0A2N9VRR7_9HYPH|nr:hypothetical protein [Phyllobacterium zundukense]ATU92609.1 hypothetical protein BLM14_13990 [Phyllobacterium zundukense]PIO42185.1 hypothetical protein B5P45_24450 [Phyllobacterium zundukense]